jgi:C1A family cysteine protease
LAIGVLGANGTAAWAHGLGARRGTPEEQAYVRAVYTEVRAVQPNELARARAAEEQRSLSGAQSLATATRPSAVDNSTSAWFPLIGDQGNQNSCVAWAVGYYYDTYTQSMDEGINVSTGDLTHTCSPSFLYPLMNDGVDEGAYLDYAMARLSVIGCSSLSLTPYNETDYTSWPSEAAWVDALSRRTINSYRISANTTAGLEAVKQLLANGRLAVVFVDMYANLYYDYPSGTGVDNDVLYATGGSYRDGHTLTLVGYDDTRTYRDHRDGQTHQGAFLAANSWGSSWGVANSMGGGKGFIWIASDAFLERSFVYDVLYTDDRPDYRPKVYALVGLSDSQRGYISLRGGAGLPSDPEGVTSPVLDHSGGTQLAVDSSSQVAVDLTDLVSLSAVGRLADVFISMEISSQALAQGQIADVEFYADPNGDGGYDVFAVPHLPVAIEVGGTGYGFLPLFSDLTWDNWAYGSIEVCFDAGIVSGYPDGAYRPANAVTRDQMAVYISRALAGGESLVPPGPAAATFLDVPVGYWAFAHIEYAVANQVVTGYGDGCYQPGTAVDRGQMAVFIARAIADPADRPDLDSYDPPATATFPDVPVDFWAYKYIEYLAEPSQAVVGGYSDGRYHPEYTCSRDQLAVFVARAFGLMS